MPPEALDLLEANKQRLFVAPPLAAAH